MPLLCGAGIVGWRVPALYMGGPRLSAGMFLSVVFQSGNGLSPLSGLSEERRMKCGEVASTVFTAVAFV